MTDKVNNEQLIESRTLPGFAVNAIISEYLEQLVKTGFYGATATDVARTLLYEAINQMIQSEQFKSLNLIEYDERLHAPLKDGQSQQEKGEAEGTEKP